MEFAYGADLGWLSQFEAEGITWTDDDGRKVDPLKAAADMGTDAVRLRVFVDPPMEHYWHKTKKETCMLGYCDSKSVLSMSERVKNAGMRLMIGFHYSDHFADPQIQDIPEAWKDADFEGLKQLACQHTEDTLRLFWEKGIEPDWIQVGNEINYGLMWPAGKLEDNPAQMTELLNAGYDAVKSVFPNCPVITHVAGMPNTSWYQSFFDSFFKNGGKTDILGFSYYPYWYRVMHNGLAVHDKKQLYMELERVFFKYKKPVMLCEIGGPQDEAASTREMIRDAILALKNLPDEAGLGIFYWEPEAAAEVLPDRYPLGASIPAGDRTLRYTEALKAYLDA